jgi:aspartyl-tRNA(Asn)/glutamyl-tRNA(Gln) amidotransferase subunit A
LVAIVLHALQQRLHGLAPIGVVSVADQAVSFIDEQNAVQRFVDFLVGLRPGLARVFGDQSRPIRFDEVLPNHRRIMAAEAAAYHRQPFIAHRDSYGPLITGLLDEGLAMPAVDYADALAWQRDYRRRVLSLFESFDVLICPATDTTAPARLTTTGTPKFQAPWSCAGVPVVSIPCGLADDGMPAALQLISRPGSEAMLLEASGACQRSLAFDASPPLME